MQMNSFKTGGIVYKICDTVFIQGKNGEFQKREIWIETPTQNGMSQDTELFKFEVLFEETGSLDNYTEGKWVDVVFVIKGREWTDKEGNKHLFNSLKPLDIKHGPNPFEDGKDLKNTPDDLSNTIVSELGDKVKDWANETPKRDTRFDQQEDDLPF